MAIKPGDVFRRRVGYKLYEQVVVQSVSLLGKVTYLSPGQIVRQLPEEAFEKRFKKNAFWSAYSHVSRKLHGQKPLPENDLKVGYMYAFNGMAVFYFEGESSPENDKFTFYHFSRPRPEDKPIILTAKQLRLLRE